MSISPAQCRAGRGLLDWSQQDLATKANVGLSTVRSFETGKRTPIVNNLFAIQLALERGGVIFVAAGETTNGGDGVRWTSGHGR